MSLPSASAEGVNCSQILSNQQILHLSSKHQFYLLTHARANKAAATAINLLVSIAPLTLIIEEFTFKRCLQTPEGSQRCRQPAPWKPAAARGHTRLAREVVVLQTHCRRGREPQARGRVFLSYKTAGAGGMISPGIAAVQRAGGCR